MIDNEIKHHILPGPLDDSSFVDSLAEKLKTTGDQKYYQGPELVKDIEGEVAFLLKLSDTFDKASNTGAKHIHLLLDIDNTIGAYNKDWENFDKRKFIIRPIFAKSIEELKKRSIQQGIEFDLGFISNREASNSQEQLQEGGQFQDFVEYVNRDLVFSSRHERIIDKISLNERKDFLEKLDIFNGGSPAMERIAEMNADGYDKLNVLNKLFQSKKEGEAYIVVDDSPIYTELLDEAKDFYGISLRDKGYYSRA